MKKVSALPVPKPGMISFEKLLVKTGLLPGKERPLPTKIVPICEPNGACEPPVARKTNSNLFVGLEPKALNTLDWKRRALEPPKSPRSTSEAGCEPSTVPSLLIKHDSVNSRLFSGLLELSASAKFCVAPVARN